MKTISDIFYIIAERFRRLYFMLVKLPLMLFGMIFGFILEFFLELPFIILMALNFRQNNHHEQRQGTVRR